MSEHAQLPEFEIVSPSTQTPPSHVDPDRLQSRRRRVILGALCVLVGFAAAHLAGIVVHDQRQRHLAHEFTVPSAEIEPGHAAMLVQIPRIGVNEIVVSGASSTELRGGPGHVIGSADLDDGGNVVVLGRSSRSGAPFGELSELVEGDAIVAKSRSGMTRAFTVATVETIEDSLAMPLRARGDQLTLVTSDADPLPRSRTVVIATADQPLAGVTEGVSASPGGEDEGPSPVRYEPLPIDVLDERSSSLLVAVVGLLVVAAGAYGLWRARVSLAETYSRRSVIVVSTPLYCVLLLLVVLLLDSVLPSTF